MKIKECRVHRYGPLGDTGTMSFGQFSLVFGPNESGKTLLVDAIIKILLRRSSQRRRFEAIDRVEEDPDGYLILEWQGADHKLPESGDVTELTDISAEECRNIFIVRSSDLGVTDQAAFYTSITDRLLGLQTDAIRLLKQQLQELGRLTNATSQGGLSDRRDWGRLSSRVKEGKRLLTRIGELQGRLQAEGYEELEGRLLEAERRLLELNRESELLEMARQKKEYEDAVGDISEARKNLRAAQKLEAFTEERRETWHDAERDQARLRREVKGLEAAIGEREARTRDLSQLERQAEGKLRRLQRTCDATTEIGRKIEQLMAQGAWWEGNKHLIPVLRRASAGFAVLTALILVALAVTAFPLVVYLAAASLVCTVVSASGWAFLTLRRGRVDKNAAEVRAEAAKCGISGQDTVDLAAAIRRLHEELEAARDEVAELRANLGSARREMEERRGSVQAKRQGLEASQRIVREIQVECGITRRRTFERKLRERQRIEGEVGKGAHLLRTRFDSSGGELEDELRYWQESAEALAPADGEAVIPTYDEQRAADVESQRQELQETIRDIEETRAQHRDEMDAVGREATSVLDRTEPVLVDTGPDLGEVEKAVTGFVREVDERMQLCLEAIGILEEIEQEEGQQVATLLGTSSDISTMFGEITGGRYRQVGFDPEAGTIWAETDQGSRLEASCLSKGAYDQLYLAIRLSLAKKLLGDETGFLLLDDPFLAADSERLSRQLQILHSLVGHGWQVIYLTVKDEIRQFLAQDIQAKRVWLHELSRLTA